jgi:hypothetical protein
MIEPEFFLSASIPAARPGRVIAEKYSATADLMNIREATRAAVIECLRQGRLVFGGHPAITPLVVEVANAFDRIAAVTVYQSRIFEQSIPSETHALNIRWVDAAANEDSSLTAMREQMIGRRHRYRAAFFIGGMEGVEQEFSLFTRRFPNAAVLPVASTGAAAAHLFELLLMGGTPMDPWARVDMRTVALLKESVGYAANFRELLKTLGG